jgi:hypothetical protein
MLPPEVFVSVFSTLTAYSLCAVEYSSPLFAKIIEKNSNKLAQRRIIIQLGGFYWANNGYHFDQSPTLHCFDEHVWDAGFKRADAGKLCCEVNICINLNIEYK